MFPRALRRTFLKVRLFYRRRLRFRTAWRLSQRIATPPRRCRNGVTVSACAVPVCGGNTLYHLERLASGSPFPPIAGSGSQRASFPRR